MCGIVGIVNTNTSSSLQEGAIDRMQKSVTHRGPDAHGVFHGEGFAFGHTRLSIIDVSDAGIQPFVSQDGRYVLVFNGEIYNYKELRESHFLGESFRSDSDTEVLLRMLIMFGTHALQYLRGMFAFAFFDIQGRRLILASDVFGKKPIFYAWAGDTFLFASEPKAILASGYVHPELDRDVVAPYFLHEYCPAPRSGFQGVETLLPGRYLEVQGDTHNIVRWWKAEVTPKYTMSFTQALSKFDELLGQAVERRMVADVPVGLFLSGGLDSSTIGWYMRQIKQEGEIHSCSIAFEDTSFNEEHIASQVASGLRFTHHAHTFTKDTFLESLRELVPLLDIPFGDASLLPTYALSKLAKKHMKVVLDGDGSDELLGGYGTFSAYEVASYMNGVPRIVWERLATLADTVFPVSHAYFSPDFKIKSFLRGVGYPPERNIQVWLGAYTERELHALLLSPHNLHALFNTVDSIVESNVRDTFDRASLYHIASYLHGDILAKIDRASMAASLEARTPFLDVDVAEFLLRLPSSFKRNKRILRELMKGRLPTVVLSRKKQGFGIPISSWFSDSLLPFVEDTLSPEKIEQGGMFRYEYVRRLIDEHRAKTHDHRKKLWTLISFQLWYEQWILNSQKR